MPSYDCIVIGSGPGGYVAAIRAAQLGMKTAVVEKDKVGGRCLNYACIPAKAVLRVADVLAEIDDADEFGIAVAGREVDYDKVSARRDKVIKTLTGGVSGLFKKNKIDVIEGVGKLAGPGKVEVGGETYDATKAIVLATGSVARPVPGTQFGGRVIGTEEAWALPELPKSLAVLGAGASGSEIASAYGRLGSDVMLFEALDRVLPTEDVDISKVAGRAFGKQNIKVHTGTLVTDVQSHDDKVTFAYGDQTGEAEYLVIAAGRGPDIEALGLDAAGRQADRPRADRGRRRAAHVGQGRLRDRRSRPRPGARAQGLRRGHHRGRGRRGREDAPDRVHRHPARDVLLAQRGLLRAHRGAGARAGHRRRRSARSSTARSAPARSTAIAAA